MKTDFSKLDHDVLKAIKWVAAEYQFLEDFKEEIACIEKSGKHPKAMWKAAHFLRYIAGAERRADTLEKAVGKTLDELCSELSAHLKEEIKITQIINSIRSVSEELGPEMAHLEKYASAHVGQLHEDLSHLNNASPKPYQELLLQLTHDIDETTKWIRAIEISLKKVHTLVKESYAWEIPGGSEILLKNAVAGTLLAGGTSALKTKSDGFCMCVSEYYSPLKKMHWYNRINSSWMFLTAAERRRGWPVVCIYLKGEKHFALAKKDFGNYTLLEDTTQRLIETMLSDPGPISFKVGLPILCVPWKIFDAFLQGGKIVTRRAWEKKIAPHIVETSPIVEIYYQEVNEFGGKDLILATDAWYEVFGVDKNQPAILAHKGKEYCLLGVERTKEKMHRKLLDISACLQHDKAAFNYRTTWWNVTEKTKSVGKETFDIVGSFLWYCDKDVLELAPGQRWIAAVKAKLQKSERITHSFAKRNR